MQEWSLHNSNTGGFFQCNRFVQNDEDADWQRPGEEGGDANRGSNANNGGGRASEEVPYSRMMFAEDTGSSHAETIRQRLKAQRVQRFIHHYTRYQAHNESMVLEMKMSRETVARIYNGLLDTVQGRLKWLQGNLATNPLIEETSQLSAEDLDTLIRENKGTVSSLLEESTGLPSASGGEAEADAASSSMRKSLSTKFRKSGGKEGGVNAQTSSALSFLSTLLPVNPDSQRNRGQKEGSIEDKQAAAAAAAQKGSLLLNQWIVNNRLKLRCIEFLNEGFEELVRCRMFLRGSFPFAFYAFNEHDEDDLWGTDPYAAMSILNNGGDPNAPRSTNQSTPSGKFAGLSYGQKRALKARMLMRKHDYEQLQADLEMLTEMLSNVVARRRLRAAMSQIEQARRSARSKRIEFEETIHSWLAADALALEDIRSGYGYSSYGHGHSRGSRSRHGRHRTHRRRQHHEGAEASFDGGAEAEDDPEELAELVAQIELMYSNSNEDAQGSPPPSSANAGAGEADGTDAGTSAGVGDAVTTSGMSAFDLQAQVAMMQALQERHARNQEAERAAERRRQPHRELQNSNPDNRQERQIQGGKGIRISVNKFEPAAIMYGVGGGGGTAQSEESAKPPNPPADSPPPSSSSKGMLKQAAQASMMEPTVLKAGESGMDMPAPAPKRDSESIRESENLGEEASASAGGRRPQSSNAEVNSSDARIRSSSSATRLQKIRNDYSSGSRKAGGDADGGEEGLPDRNRVVDGRNDAENGEGESADGSSVASAGHVRDEDQGKVDGETDGNSSKKVRKSSRPRREREGGDEGRSDEGERDRDREREAESRERGWKQAGAR
jgi:hypothetical protein